MKRTLTALVLGTSLIFGSDVVGYAADFQKGAAAAERGDYAAALVEWRPLAEHGDAFAQFNLGLFYLKGYGVLKDYTEAVKWFLKSAEQGNANAQHTLGGMYYGGYGVEQDYAGDIKWYRKSAEQEYANAQFNLGQMYEYGFGVLQDNVYAHMWRNIAASNGDVFAAGQRALLEKKMTTEQIAEAQKLARECVKKNYKGCL
jgi:TPR repeat protein